MVMTWISISVDAHDYNLKMPQKCIIRFYWIDLQFSRRRDNFNCFIHFLNVVPFFIRSSMEPVPQKFKYLNSWEMKVDFIYISWYWLASHGRKIFNVLSYGLSGEPTGEPPTQLTVWQNMVPLIPKHLNVCTWPSFRPNFTGNSNRLKLSEK